MRCAQGPKWSLGAEDFAGGIVIHTTAGFSSLVCAMSAQSAGRAELTLSPVIGQRRNFDRYHGEFPSSNLLLSAIGAALLWVGWFGFNGGSALAAYVFLGAAAYLTVVGVETPSRPLPCSTRSSQAVHRASCG